MTNLLLDTVLHETDVSPTSYFAPVYLHLAQQMHLLFYDVYLPP